MAPTKQMTLDRMFGKGKTVGGVTKVKRASPIKLPVSDVEEKKLAL